MRILLLILKVKKKIKNCIYIFKLIDFFLTNKLEAINMEIFFSSQMKIYKSKNVNVNVKKKIIKRVK